MRGKTRQSVDHPLLVILVIVVALCAVWMFFQNRAEEQEHQVAPAVAFLRESDWLSLLRPRLLQT